ncbi:HNH endonuclease [Vibrio natriegens]|uniref:HNH endonuclease n=1 Tax=Vibrio natriegens TaxID=691 RepID=UPI0009BD0115|nr:HNH endonuclease [Vibrio natriegens]
MNTQKDGFLPKNIELKAKEICESVGIKRIESTARAHQLEVCWGISPQDYLYIDRKLAFSSGELQVVIHPELNKKLREELQELPGVKSPKGTKLGKLILSSQYKGFQNYVSNTQHQGAAWRLDLTEDLRSLRLFLSALRSEPIKAELEPISHTSSRDTDFIEGEKYDVSLSKYERSKPARKACIEHYGCTCLLCGYDFEANFGNIGKGFIHVHHITPLEEIGESYKVDPINDLIPLCPNCHAMVHRRKPPYSLHELQKIREQKL